MDGKTQVLLISSITVDVERKERKKTLLILHMAASPAS